MKSLIIHIGLILISIILTISLIEILLNKFIPNNQNEIPWQTTDKYILDDQLIYRLKPNKFSEWKTDEFHEQAQTNNLGFRNNMNFSFTKNKDIFRIFVVGDSFTFGHGLTNSQSYPYLLENKLIEKKCFEKQLEVINAGVPGYSPDQEYRLIVDFIRKLDPDLIIWNFIAGDLEDMTGANPSLYGLDTNNKLISLNAKYNWLFIQSYLYRIVPKIIKQSKIFNLINSNLYRITLLQRKPFMKKPDLQNWSLEKLILQINNLKTSNLMIVKLFAKEDFYKSEQQKSQPFFDDFFDFLKKNKISALDTFKVLPDYYEKKFNRDIIQDTSRNFPKMLFFGNDPHPNESGTDIYSEIVSDFICNKRL